MEKNNHTDEYKMQIQQWLDSDEQDFDIGFELFVRFSHNRPVALFLQRKRKLSKLVYELEKIAKRNLIIEAPAMPIRPIQKVIQVAQSKEEGTHEPGEKIKELGKLKVIFDNKIHYEDLPEDMKKVYDEIRDRYKRMRACHEKMKLAKTDDERKEHRSSLVYLDDKIAEGWNILDTWLATKEKAADEKEEHAAAEVTKEINAARSYLSRNVKGVEKLSGVKREKMMDKLKERLEVLKKHNAELKKETREALFKVGLLTDWREAQ